MLRRLRDQGLAILFVTHFLEQIYAICDRITVLRNGERVGEYLKADLPPAALITAMVGRELGAAARPQRARCATTAAPPRPRRRAALGRRGQLQPVDLALRARARSSASAACSAPAAPSSRGCCSGSTARDSGELRDRRRAGRASTRPAQAIRHGLAMCPEERKHDGIVAELSVRENIVLALQARLGVLALPLARRASRRSPSASCALLGIKTADLDTPVALLSGGNQQKVVLARWLATEPRLLILDEPTRGIDVAAKQEIMNEILALARARPGRALHLVGDGRGRARRRPHRRAARPTQGRRAAGRQLRAGRSTDLIAAGA